MHKLILAYEEAHFIFTISFFSPKSVYEKN